MEDEIDRILTNSEIINDMVDKIGITNFFSEYNECGRWIVEAINEKIGNTEKKIGNSEFEDNLRRGYEESMRFKNYPEVDTNDY
jgi:hypothetical protein